VTLGDAFLLKAAISDHIWFVAYQQNDIAVTFNFTTLQSSTIDRACVVTPKEYQALRYESVIAYQHGKLWDSQKFDMLGRGGVRRYLDPIPGGILTRIQCGAVQSKFTPNKIKVLFQALLPPTV
jgi:hypothetical protein